MLACGSVVFIDPEDSIRHPSCACVGGRKSSYVFFEYPLYEEVLLLQSQSLLVYVAGSAVPRASYTGRERSLREVVGLCSSSLTLRNISIKVADSCFNMFFTGVHLRSVNVEKSHVLVRVLSSDGVS